MTAKTYAVYFYPVHPTAKGVEYNGQSLDEVKILLDPRYGSKGKCFASCEDGGDLIAWRESKGADVVWSL